MDEGRHKGDDRWVIFMGQNEIYHHGIKGQKWGVRRYQNKDGSLTSAGRQRLKNSSSRKSQPSSTKEKVEDLITRNKNRKIADLTEGSEMAVVYATYAATILGSYGYLMHKQKQIKKRKSEEFDELKDNREIKSLEDIPKIKGENSASENARITNPDFPNPGTTSNCVYCTMAMAMREKGYDVKAIKANDGTFTDMAFSKAFNSEEIRMPRKTDTKGLMDTLGSNGEGSYGNLTVSWKAGGRHSIFWKNENGRTRIYDGQNGKEYTKTYSDLKLLTSNIDMNDIYYNRLDNCEPTDYALAAVEINEKK